MLSDFSVKTAFDQAILAQDPHFNQQDYVPSIPNNS
jgi:hypothetical protein